MTVKETAAVIDWIERLYWRKKDDEARKDLIKLWATIFVDYEMDVVKYAVMQYIKQDQRGYPPMPGQVLSFIKERNVQLHSANRIREHGNHPRITLVNLVQFLIQDELGQYLPKGSVQDD